MSAATRHADRSAPAVTGMRPYLLWLDPVPRPGWANMALDHALLERAARGERWLRLYCWRPCLSFGRHEPAERRYDRAKVTALGLATVRRPTGGRGVWHARELTYAVAAPVAALGTLAEAYLAIHRMLRDAVAGLGAPVQLAPQEKPASPGAGACFSHATGGEVLSGGRKLVGSAQLRRAGALLQHGSLLLEDDQRTVRQVTRGAAPPDRSAPLGRLLRRPVGWPEAAAAVVRAAEACWGVCAGRVTDPGELVAEAKRHAARYRSPEWTWHAHEPAR